MKQKSGEGLRGTVDDHRGSSIPIDHAIPGQARNCKISTAYAHTGLPSEQFLHISMLLRDCRSERRKSL
jgi:hypothetical protein